MKLKGYLLAAIAAATYGTNPAFAVPLYEQGMNPNSVLLFRYMMGLPVLAAMLTWRGHPIALQQREIMPLAILGLLMGTSSLTLFEAYNYMNSGVASTLLFVYPVMVALLMTFFFHEHFRATTGICLALTGAGLIMLLRATDGSEISVAGIALVMISSLTYAIYLVMTNVSKTVRGIPTLKLLFWQLVFGSSVFVFVIATGSPLTLPSQSSGWINLAALALLPTIISLGCTTAAIHSIGSTPTALFGALEPVTAVALSVAVLNQAITVRELAGGLLIVAATTLVVAADPVDKVLLRMRKMFPKLRK